MNPLYVVGIGPGDFKRMTFEAKQVLDSSDLIIGYTVYTELVRKQFPGKTYYATGMRQERERCLRALEAAKEGTKVSVVCSGDAGVYGMAGLLMELGATFLEVEIVAIAGITAALSGAAALGAPLGHDFAVISLSDLMTSWEQIERRLRAAAMADFCICLYNPSSKKRKDYLKRACIILSEYRKAETVCGLVRNIGREGESVAVLSLAELREIAVDMFTTVFIGNSCTKQIKGQMVTPRGYHLQK